MTMITFITSVILYELETKKMAPFFLLQTKNPDFLSLFRLHKLVITAAVGGRRRRIDCA